MARWSKLQKLVYQLISPDIHFQLHCAAYPMRSQRGSTDIPRYWITLGKEIIWDYPANFVPRDRAETGDVSPYRYAEEVHEVTLLIREYIDTPKAEIFEKCFVNDRWGLTDILKAADRRIGARRLRELYEKTDSVAVKKLIAQRLETEEALPPPQTRTQEQQPGT